MSVRSTILIEKEEDWFVASSVETGVASQGKTMEEAIQNLKEALELFFEDNIPENLNRQIFVTTLEVAV
ncbi:MAG: type II toxin-antitoxin system HicB family antitoxin [Clostridia bacterium]|nr:type II toxin-antitoxin system HicB family antitoxin [Clostridia bacterium]